MNREAESIRLRRRGSTEDEEESGGKDIPKIDVHNITGLITILTVNIHQIESLLQVGSDLGFQFWMNIVLVSISIVCVYPLLMLRMWQGQGFKLSPRLCLGSFWLMVITFLVNLTLQIFDDLDAQCMVLLNQSIPPVVPPPPNCTVP
uniref:Uncharacterized protein n=1 Tax=Anopheles epiroticus TaxID=199890 RepID=A0A182PCR0_9DIPT